MAPTKPKSLANLDPTGSGPFYHKQGHEVVKGHPVADDKGTGHSWHCKTCDLSYDPDEVYGAGQPPVYPEAEYRDPSSNPIQQVDFEPRHVDLGVHIHKQTLEAGVWRMQNPATEDAHTYAEKQPPKIHSGDLDDPHSNTHYGLWQTAKGKLPPEGEDQRIIGDKLEGFSSPFHVQPLGAFDLYRSYKNTPHAPASAFLKYLVHRINHVEEYNDPEKGHDLDKQFLMLVQKGAASEKNGHVTIDRLHQWVKRHSKEVVPQLLAEKARLNALVQRGVGLNVRSINGEPYVALTRGLSTDTMSDEHPLSSHADLPDTGFGGQMHRSWVPLKDLWYSFDMGPRYPSGNMGPEDEYLVSNTGTRYEAQAHDVKATRMKGWSSELPQVFDDSTDEELAATVDSAKDQSNGADLFSPYVMGRPNAGPKVADAVRKIYKDNASEGQDPLLAAPRVLARYKWFPREAAITAALDGSLHALENPNLTPHDLEAMAPTVLNLNNRDAVNAWFSNPNLNSQTVEHVWHALKQDARSFEPRWWGATISQFLKKPLVGPHVLTDAIQLAKQKGTDYGGHPDKLPILLAVTENPHHTEDHIREVWDFAKNHGYLKSRNEWFDEDNHNRARMKVIFQAGKVPEDIVRELWETSNSQPISKHNNDPHNPADNADNALSLFVTDNKQTAPHILAKLGAEGFFKPRLDVDKTRHQDPDIMYERLKARARHYDSLEPELQPILVDEAYRRFNDPATVASYGSAAGLGDMTGLDTLAQCTGLTQDTIGALANCPSSQIRETLLRNKSVTKEQIREAYPKAFPWPTRWDQWPYTESRIADDIAMAYNRRDTAERSRLLLHFIKPLPADISKSEKDLFQAKLRDWLGEQKVTGYYLPTTREKAHHIIAAGHIVPDFTDEILEGEATFAHKANPVFADEWQKHAQPDDVLLYFETPTTPEVHDDGRFYWTHDIPIENAKLDGIEPLEKMHAALRFPKLGITDDRRETKVIDTKTSYKVAAHAVANQMANQNMPKQEYGVMKRNPEWKGALISETAKSYMQRKGVGSGFASRGITAEGVAGVGQPGHGLPEVQRLAEPGMVTGQSAQSYAFTPQGNPHLKSKVQAAHVADPNNLPTTVQHENLHRIFARIQHKHGERERVTLTYNLLRALPKPLRDTVMQYAIWRYPEGIESEEVITELQSYLNQASERDEFHRKSQHPADFQKDFHTRMKRAWSAIQAAAEVADTSWLHRVEPWLKKGEASSVSKPIGEAGLTALQAHEVFMGSNLLRKNRPDLVDVNSFAFEFEHDLKLHDEVVERYAEVELRKMALIHDDEEHPMEVWRVQNEQGEGPYASYMATDKPPPVKGSWRKSFSHPEPQHDFSRGDIQAWRHDHKRMRFGFPNKEEAVSWFGHGIEGGISEQIPPDVGHQRLVRVLASKVWKSKSGKQVLFVPHVPSPMKKASYTHQKYGAVKMPDEGVWWHGTPSGDLRGGASGLHVGTREAAEQALHARIGYPAEGRWDGTREYGKTKLAGAKALQARGIYQTGYNGGLPDEDFFPTKMPTFSGGEPMLPTHKPEVFPLRIIGQMSNTPYAPHQDFAANGRMTSLLRRGSARRGFYYVNQAEDSGSLSAVLPGPEHIRRADGPMQKAEEFEAPQPLTDPALAPGEESAAMAQFGWVKAHARALAAARFLVGRKTEVDEDMFRLALAIYDGDYERAALVSVGLSDSEPHLKALRAALELGEFTPEEKSLSKTEPTANITAVDAGAPDCQDTADEVARAVTANLIQPLTLGGKHSKGAMAARDPKTGSVWLLKPGSGKQSPAAGARDDASTQSAREAAFWHVAKLVGLGNYYPRADLLIINHDAPVAAMKLLGGSWRSLDERNRQVDGYAKEVLEPYLKRGDVHRIAALDWILGNPDSHGQNVMVHAESVAFIDHGSAFAGPNFAPGRDTKSYTPYCLRVFAPSGYSKKKPEERVSGLPVLDRHQDADLKKWLQSIDPASMQEVMERFGIGEVAQKAVLARLDDLQGFEGPNLSAHLNSLWAGVGSSLAKSTEAGLGLLRELRSRVSDNAEPWGTSLSEQESGPAGGSTRARKPFDNPEDDVEPPDDWYQNFQSAPITVNFPAKAVPGMMKEGRLLNMEDVAPAKAKQAADEWMSRYADPDDDPWDAADEGKQMADPIEEMLAKPYIANRREWENKVYGIDPDEGSGRRPVYGALHYRHQDPLVGGAGAAPAYGPLWLKLRPEVRKRSTFTSGDTFGNSPEQVFDESTLHHVAQLHFGPHQRNMEPYKTMGGKVEPGKPPYVESQIHGGVSLANDVDSINIGPSVKASEAVVRKAAVKLGKQYMVPVFHHHASGEVEQLHTPMIRRVRTREPHPGDFKGYSDRIG
jgi:hypothetical protein